MFKRGRIRVLATAGLAVILVLAMSATAFGFTGARTVKAIYNNIKIYVNGSVLQTEEDPFIIGGRTYLPLRAIGEAMGAAVNWNGDTREVTISGINPAVQEQLIQKDKRIAELEAEIAELKGNEPGETTTDTEKSLSGLTSNLNTSYDELQDVAIDDVRLTGDEGYVTVNIDVDLEDYDNEWENLTDRDIQNWVKRLCEDIQAYYSLNTDITGKIKDIDSKDTLIQFDKDGDNAVDVDFEDNDYRDTTPNDGDISDAEQDLEGTTVTIANHDFTVDQVEYDTDLDEINVEITAEDDINDNEWAALDREDIKADVLDFCKDIEQDFNDFSAPAYVNLDLNESNGGYLDQFEYDVEDAELD